MERATVGHTHLDESVLRAGMKHGALAQQAHELIHMLWISDTHCSVGAAQIGIRSVTQTSRVMARAVHAFPRTPPPFCGRDIAQDGPLRVAV